MNTDQRFEAWRSSDHRSAGYRGSLVWHEVKGETYLLRSYYDSARVRRQKVEGRLGPETEALKAAWEAGREAAASAASERREALKTQAAINRAIGLGRVPMIAARILRAIDRAGLLGKGLRVAGTNAIYAYEAAAGVMVDPGVTSTLDIDLLLDARRSLKVVVDDDVADGTLIGLLRRADKSFERTRRTFSAANRDGYLVDLIKPMRNPPWKPERTAVGQSEDELDAVEIEGLVWQESAPPFEATAIDEKGAAVRVVTIDPRVFAAHKLWMAGQPSRDPVKRRRDRAQAQVVADIVARYLTHLPFENASMRMLPKPVFEAAAPLFSGDP